MALYFGSGFQERWWAQSAPAEEYLSALRAAFELHLAVGVLRVPGGLDASNLRSSALLVARAAARQCSDTSEVSESTRANSVVSYEDERNNKDLTAYLDKLTYTLASQPNPWLS